MGKMHWLFCGEDIHHIECTDNQKHETLLNEQKFTKEQVYYALNLSLLLRITMSRFVGRIYGSACSLVSSQNVSPFSLPKDFTIQSNTCFSEHASSESLSSPHFLQKSEILKFFFKKNFSGLDEAAKCLPNFHPFELDLPTFWTFIRTKHILSNEKLHSKSKEEEAVL